MKSYRADNGVFSCKEFENEILKDSQLITYSGVAIRAVVERARMMLIHDSIWNEQHVNISLWPFALSHSCYIWNTVPKLNQFAPVELLSRTMMARN